MEANSSRSRTNARTTTYAYHGLATSVTNALNQSRTFVRNSQGKVTIVTDAQGKTTTSTYDPFGNAVQIKDAAGSQIDPLTQQIRQGGK